VVTVNVLMISPGYPAEMAFFTRGLARAGAAVIGLGDQSPDALPPAARNALSHYVHVASLAGDGHVTATVRDLARHVGINQVECLWGHHPPPRTAHGPGDRPAVRGRPLPVRGLR